MTLSDAIAAARNAGTLVHIVLTYDPALRRSRDAYQLSVRTTEAGSRLAYSPIDSLYVDL